MDSGKTQGTWDPRTRNPAWGFKHCLSWESASYRKRKKKKYSSSGNSTAKAQRRETAWRTQLPRVQGWEYMEWEAELWEVVSRVRGVLEKHQSWAMGHPRRGPASAGYSITLPTGNPHCVQASASARGESGLKVVALGPKSFALVHQGGFGHDRARV